MTRLQPHLGITLDCADPVRLANFWGPALGYHHAGSAAQYVLLRAPGDEGPRLLLQRVDEPKATKNRMHLDLHVSDIEWKVARLEELGATRLDADPIEEVGTRWVRMADPEGNELCVCLAHDD